MNAYTPDLFPSPDRIVPHDEGMARLAQVKAAVAALPDDMPPMCRSGIAIWARHDWNGLTGRCDRCGLEMGRLLS